MDGKQGKVIVGPVSAVGHEGTRRWGAPAARSSWAHTVDSSPAAFPDGGLYPCGLLCPRRLCPPVLALMQARHGCVRGVALWALTHASRAIDEGPSESHSRCRRRARGTRRCSFVRSRGSLCTVPRLGDALRSSAIRVLSTPSRAGNAARLAEHADRLPRSAADVRSSTLWSGRDAATIVLRRLRHAGRRA